MWRKRSALFSVGILIVTVAAVAARAAAHPASRKAGSELVFQFPTAALDLDPSTSQDNNVAMPLWNAWFEYLIQQQPGGGAFSPMLASSWTISKNGLVYTFHLRKGVRFSNGKPMTSRDVVFSLTRSMQPSISLLHFLLPKLGRIQAVGSGTVKITLKKRWPALLADLASPTGAIYPAGSVTKATAKKYFFSHPVGTGPFVLTSTVPNSSYVVTRNPYYWDKQHGPHVSRISFEVVTDDTAQANAVRGGRADVAASPPPNLLSSMKNNPSVKVVAVPSALVELIALNTKKPPFNNQKIRQAVSLAIDRSAIVRSGLFGYARPATTFLVGPPKATFQNTKLNLYPYDVAKAKRLIKQSGVKTPITIPFEVSTGTAQDAILNVVQSNLSAIGIKVKAIRKDAASVDNDIIGEKYTMNTTFWGDISGDPSVQPEFAIDPKYCCDAYFTGYHDQALINLTHKAIVTPNRAKAQRLFNEMQRRVAQAAFLLPLYYPDLIYLTSSRVTGFKVSPYNLYDWKSIGIR